MLVKAENGETYIMAEALMEKVMTIGGFSNYEVLATYPGAFFENMIAQHPFLDKTSRLVNAEYVTMDSGTAAFTPPPALALMTTRPVCATEWSWWFPSTTRAVTPSTPASMPV